MEQLEIKKEALQEQILDCMKILYEYDIELINLKNQINIIKYHSKVLSTCIEGLQKQHQKQLENEKIK